MQGITVMIAGSMLPEEKDCGGIFCEDGARIITDEVLKERELEKIFGREKPDLIITDRLVRKLLDAGACLKIVVKGIAEHDPDWDDRRIRELEKQTTELLLKLGIPAHVKGYVFLKEGVMMAVKRPGVMDSVTKSLYPAIACRHSTTGGRVERAIRNAIELAWVRGDLDTIHRYFEMSEGRAERPSNSEFIARMSDTVRLDLPEPHKS